MTVQGEEVIIARGAGRGGAPRAFEEAAQADRAVRGLWDLWTLWTL